MLQHPSLGIYTHTCIYIPPNFLLKCSIHIQNTCTIGVWLDEFVLLRKEIKKERRKKRKERKSEVVQLCLSLCDPVDCSPPGSSVHGVLQARILEWVAIGIGAQSSALQADTLPGESLLSTSAANPHIKKQNIRTLETPLCYILVITPTTLGKDKFCSKTEVGKLFPQKIRQ